MGFFFFIIIPYMVNLLQFMEGGGTAWVGGALLRGCIGSLLSHDRYGASGLEREGHRNNYV